MLRDYQQEAIDTLFRYWGGKESAHPCILQLSTGCLAKGTPVLMGDNSLKNVEDIEDGDDIWSFDDTGVPHKNVVFKVIMTSTKPKPMIELNYADEKIITTYDHPFFNGEGHYPLYQLVWGAMEENERAQLQLLCEQYGTPFDDKAVWCKHSGSNEAYPGRKWLLQNTDGWEDNQTPQSCSGDMVGQPYQLAMCKPHQWGQNGQPCRKPRMVFCKIQCLVGNQGGGNKTSSQQEQRKSRQFGQGVHPAVLSRQYGEDTTSGEVCTLRHSSANVPSSRQSDSIQICKGQVHVKTSEPYYTISLCKAPYTYCIGRGCFLTHNSGKSHIIAEIVRKLQQPVLVLQPTKEILEQNYEKLVLAGVPKKQISICSASAGGWEIGWITLATIGTIAKHFDKCKHFKVIVIDECDVVNNNNADGQYLGFFNALRNQGCAPRIVGLTATPWRNQNFLDGLGNPSVFCRPLTRIFTKGGKGTPHTEWFWKGGVIYKCEIPFLQERGFLAPTQYYEAETDWSFVNNLPGRVDFDTNEMTKWLDFDKNMSRFHQAVKWCMDNNLKTIVFTPNIDMNFRLGECIVAGGGTARTMDSNNDTRKSRQQKMDEFRQGKYQFLVNVGMVGRGVDVPSVDAVLLCRPTKSLSLYMQYVGRCLRPDPANPTKVARVLDLSGNVARFGRVEDVALAKEKAMSKTGWQFEKDIITVEIGGKKYKWEKVS